MIQVVSLDLWGTLIGMGDRDAARAWRLREFALVLHDFGHPVDTDRLAEVADTQHREYLRRQRNHGEQIHPHTQITDLLSRLDIPVGDDLLRLLATVHVHANLRACPQPAPGARAVLRQLRATGRHVVVSSNVLTSTGAVTRSILDHLSLSSLVDGMYFSDELDVAKPHRDFFRAVAEAVRATPAEILHVGDDWRTDVQGAADAGWQPVWFNPTSAPPPRDTPAPPHIATLDMLLPLLDPATAATVPRQREQAVPDPVGDPPR